MIRTYICVLCAFTFDIKGNSARAQHLPHSATLNNCTSQRMTRGNFNIRDKIEILFPSVSCFEKKSRLLLIKSQALRRD